MKPRVQYNRHSIRLPEYDYSLAGAYFVTVCTQNRLCLFGKIIDGEMQLNSAGYMVTRWWIKLESKFPTVQIDEFMLLPNHVHGIISITESDNIPVGAAPGGRPGHPHGGAPTLGEIIGWFKTMTTNEYMQAAKKNGWPRFNGRLWQRNYYEHIIRNQNDLLHTREYIINNPRQWHIDEENPECRKTH